MSERQRAYPQRWARYVVGAIFALAAIGLGTVLFGVIVLLWVVVLP